MRVLLDENLANDLVLALVGHAVSTVHSVGWAGTKNGALLKRASGLFDAFVTMDGNLEHQQNLAALPFGVVVVSAPSNRMQDLAPLIPRILGAIRQRSGKTACSCCAYSSLRAAAGGT